MYNRLRVVLGIFVFIGLGLTWRVYDLQILSHDYYEQAAQKLHWGGIKLPAQRGEIVISDRLTGEEVALATNANLDLLYFDPKFILGKRKVKGEEQQIGDPEAIVRELAPILFPVFVERRQEAERAKTDTASSELPGARYFVKKGREVVEMTGIGGTPVAEVEAECTEECKVARGQALLLEIKMAQAQKQPDAVNTEKIVDEENPEPETSPEPSLTQEQWDKIAEECAAECEYSPTIIPEEAEPGADAPVTATDDPLSPEPDTMIAFRDWLRAQIFENADKRYVPIIRRLPPAVSNQIDELERDPELNLKGVVRISEPWRFYPEGELAAPIIGFTDHDKIGRYGVEEQFNDKLQGQDGRILTEKDTAGREIAIGEKIVERAVDGVKIKLSLDRAVQSKVEEVLARHSEELAADAAAAIVMEPDSGRIVAMAQYPRFDPNDFWKVYQKRYLTDSELQKISGEWLENHRNYPIMEEENPDGTKRHYVYQNAVGPAAYRNKNMDEMWESGSIFKSIVMAAALDAHALTPDTRCDICAAPVKLDEYYVRTWNDRYRANQTMSQTLQWSDNTGMVFVAKKLGKKPMWQYLKNFGMGKRTDIGFDSEQKGVLPLWRYQADIDQATLAFGQGVSTTSLQLITAFAALVNGGYLMKPILVEKLFFPDGTSETNEPEVRRRVISDEASAQISSMLVSVIEEGGGKFAAVPNYFVGGKTGTAQIAGFYTDKEGVKRYGYEEGIGTTIASFIGFGPLTNPKFVMLVKFDRPRANEWGSRTAAPAWSEIAEFLLRDYYRIPPER